MPDNIFYRSCFVKCKVKLVDESPMLDLPFQIYHQTVTCEGRCYFCNLTKDLEGKEVLAYIHYAIPDEETVKKFEGYLGNDWKPISKSVDVAKNWALKKEDALATTSELGVTTKYAGVDKDGVVHPYIADEK